MLVSFDFDWAHSYHIKQTDIVIQKGEKQAATPHA